MPDCTNCYYRWRVKEVLSLGFSKYGKDCPSCGQRQYISAKTQKVFTFGYLSLLFVPFLLFRIRLSDKEECLFK